MSARISGEQIMFWTSAHESGYEVTKARTWPHKIWRMLESLDISTKKTELEWRKIWRMDTSLDNDEKQDMNAQKLENARRS